MPSKFLLVSLLALSSFAHAQKAVTVNDFSQSLAFADAKLTIKEVKAIPSGDSVRITFSFEVKNYQLKNQTDDAIGKMCSNSDKGQHIHFILDNKPYVALYEPKQEIILAKNSEHYVLCFLSRSYHESLKQKGASVLYHFKIDENGNLVKMKEPKTPMVFYSRPKGDYLGKDAVNVLFDFYVWNAKLGKHYKVKADITSAGNNTSVSIDNWKAYSLKNLSMGKNSIKLTLVDSKGNKVEGPQTEVNRDFNLAEQEGRK